MALYIPWCYTYFQFYVHTDKLACCHDKMGSLCLPKMHCIHLVLLLIRYTWRRCVSRCWWAARRDVERNIYVERLWFVGCGSEPWWNCRLHGNAVEIFIVLQSICKFSRWLALLACKFIILSLWNTIRMTVHIAWGAVSFKMLVVLLR